MARVRSRTVLRGLFGSLVIGLTVAALVAPAPTGAAAADGGRPRAASSVEVDRGLVFGDALDASGVRRTLRLDPYSDAADPRAARPAVVLAHGGGFTDGSRTSDLIVDLAEVLAEQGWVVASIDYRLRADVSSPEALGAAMRDAGEDMAAAVRWLRASSSDRRVDPARIAVGGYSAGAVTALVAGLGTADRPGASGTPGQPSDVAAIVSLAGFAPANLLTPGQPPTLVVHGDRDTRVPYAYGVATCDGLVAAGSPCELLTLPGVAHDLGTQRSTVFARAAAFLAEVAAAEGPPARPREVSLRAGHGAALVEWRPPGTTGGSPLTGSRVTSEVGSVDVSAPASTALITGLPTVGAPSTQVVVAARSAAGLGPAAPPTSATTARFLPFSSSAELVRHILGRIRGAAPGNEVVLAPAVMLGDGRLQSRPWIEDQIVGSGHAARVDPVVRLYSAVLGRLPDAPGLEAWVERRRSGASTEVVAAAFCRSRELRERFGPPTGPEFIVRLYQNVLGRAPDASGLAYWTARLAGGASCARVVVGFSESVEHRRRRAVTVAVVTRTFVVQARVPALAQVEAWGSGLGPGTPTPAGLHALLARILLSPEMASAVGPAT